MYELRATPKERGCVAKVFFFCLKAMAIVIVGFICIQILIALGVFGLTVSGPLIDQEFDRIVTELEAGGFIVISWLALL